MRFYYDITAANSRSAAFKLAVGENDRGIIENEDYWPAGVSVRVWKYNNSGRRGLDDRSGSVIVHAASASTGVHDANTDTAFDMVDQIRGKQGNNSNGSTSIVPSAHIAAMDVENVNSANTTGLVTTEDRAGVSVAAAAAAVVSVGAEAMGVLSGAAGGETVEDAAVIGGSSTTLVAPAALAASASFLSSVHEDPPSSLQPPDISS